MNKLEMVQGADNMLDMVSHNTNECFLKISDVPFDGTDEITFITDLSNSVGGGDYFIESYKGKVVVRSDEVSI